MNHGIINQVIKWTQDLVFKQSGSDETRLVEFQTNRGNVLLTLHREK